MLAMVVNDHGGNQIPRGGLVFIVGTPPGACSLLQGRSQGERHRLSELLFLTVPDTMAAADKCFLKPSAGFSHSLHDLIERSFDHGQSRANA
jgi:hypothetical protein